MQASKSGRALTGRYELMHPTNYLKAADLGERDVTVTIHGIFEEHLVMQGGKKEAKPALALRSKAGRVLGKKLILNKTNAKLIAAATKEKLVQNWIGHEITLYATTTKGAKGEEMDCIRVRGRVNQSASEVPEDMSRAPERIDEAGADEPASDNAGGAS